MQPGEFVQILNVARCPLDHNIKHCSVPCRTKEHIAAILYTQENKITFRFQSVQEQHGSADCGLFAIAFAVSLCGGENPLLANYVQHKLRQHLWQWFINRGFPQKETRKKTWKTTGRRNISCILCVQVTRRKGHDSMQRMVP